MSDANNQPRLRVFRIEHGPLDEVVEADAANRLEEPHANEERHQDSISANDAVETSAFLGDDELSIDDIHDDGTVLAECSTEDLDEATLADFPELLRVRTQSPNGFDTHLFHDAEITRAGGSSVCIEFICHHPNKYWEGTWGLSHLLGAVRDQAPHFSGVMVGDVDLEDDWKRLTLRFAVPESNAGRALRDCARACKEIIHAAEIALAGMQWKPEYETDERLFCEEVLGPILRRMGFLSVRYTAGTREYGKDFTFSELTPFGSMRHYGLQAKAGDVSGGVNSAVDELIGQVSDAFAMPYYDLGSHEPRYISTFVIAISGKFTSNAREKIVHKIPKGLHGSVLFLDRETLQGLVNRFWKAS